MPGPVPTGTQSGLGTGERGEEVSLAIMDVVSWLDTHLTQPRLIAEACAQWTGGTHRRQRNGALRWEGGRDGTDGHSLRDLIAASKVLELTAYLGPDDRFWWTREPVKQAETPEAA